MMTRRSIIAAVVATVVLASVPAQAQSVPGVTLPSSPRGLSAAQVGGSWVESNGGRQYRDGKWITVDYGRPLLRGRPNIFGTIADYGQAISEGAPVWRAGANATTRLTTQVALRFGNTTIQPGVYNVLVQLKGGAWTLVLTTQTIQEQYDPAEKVKLYGSYNYDPAFDVLRAPMIVDQSPAAFEQFTIEFVDMTASGGTLLMVWDRTVALVPFTVG